MNCNCTWQINYRTRTVTSKVPSTELSSNSGVPVTEWYFTGTSTLEHKGHSPVPPQSLLPETTIIKFRKDIPLSISDDVKELVISGLTRLDIQNHVQRTHKVIIDDLVFVNLYEHLKDLYVTAHVRDDWNAVTQWAQQQGPGTLVAISHDPVTHTGVALVYMSPIMTYNFRRNGEVLFMDTTHATNRYRYPLLIIAGVDQFGSTCILAAAMIRQQREEDFDWVLSSIKKHVGDRAWASVTTVAMDGDLAMKNAVTRHLPYRFMARCIWHIEQNILTNISKFGTAGIDDSVKTELHASIKQLIYTTSRSQFELDKAKLDTQLQSKSGNAALDKFRLSVYQYLTTNTWPNVEAFAAWSVNNQLTFGAHTTQRSESLHSLLKRQSRNGKKVSISTTALELFTFLHNTAHNHCIGGANKDYRYHQQTKTNIDAYTSIQRETITDLTLYASNEVVKQFGSLNSWKAQQSGTRTLTTIGPLTTVIEWNVNITPSQTSAIQY